MRKRNFSKVLYIRVEPNLSEWVNDYSMKTGVTVRHLVTEEIIALYERKTGKRYHPSCPDKPKKKK